MRFYNADFHLIFDSGEISDFRVPGMYIWLNCAFLLWILGALGCILSSVLGGPGDHWGSFLRHRQTGIEKIRFRTSHFRLLLVMFLKEYKVSEFALPGVPMG